MLFSVCSLYLTRDLSTLELFSASDVEDLAAPTLPFLRFLRVFFFFFFILSAFDTAFILSVFRR